MKAKFTLLFLAITFTIGFIDAQSPQLINYQAIVRDAAGYPRVNGAVVSLKFIIHDQTETGTPVFTETQIDTANEFGLVNTKIGVTGNLSQVNWGNGPKYLEVDLDATGGNNFTPMGNAQLLSVPYALYAANSAAGPQGVTGPVGPTGLVGVTGANGLNGAAGANGSTGATGPSGQDGANGLNGVTGSTGQDGANGLNGITGVTGPSGQDGAAGATGVDGATGAVGATGLNGATGATGFLSAGTSVGNTTYWDGTQWVLNSANLYNNGANIGIGTTTPGNSLTVNGNTGIWNSNKLFIYSDTGLAVRGYLGQYQSASDLSLAATGYGNWLRIGSDSGNIAFFPDGHLTNGEPKVVINPFGYVGIGTFYPGNNLTVNGDAAIWNSNQLIFYSDTGLAVRGYLGQYQPASDLSLVATGYGNWLRIGCDSGTIAFSPDGHLTNGEPKVVINPKGYVGIGTQTPTVPLEVDMQTATTPYSNTSVNIAHLLSNNNSVLTGTGPLSIVDGQVAISAQGDIVGQGTIAVASSVTYSDQRIKNIIGQSNAVSDLDVLNKIKITDYTMKDSLWWGYTPFKKVIAQQVEEVYPQAVGRKTDFVPNIYAQATKVEKTDKGYLITVDKDLPELNTKKVRLEVPGTGKVEADFIALTGKNQLKVSTAIDITKAPVFVFGTQVEDFRTVDYDAISMLNVSATQELTKELKDAQERLKQLEAENEKLKTCNTQQQQINKEQSDMMKSMKAQIDLINEQLNLTTRK